MCGCAKNVSAVVKSSSAWWSQRAVSASRSFVCIASVTSLFSSAGMLGGSAVCGCVPMLFQRILPSCWAYRSTEPIRVRLRSNSSGVDTRMSFATGTSDRARPMSMAVFRLSVSSAKTTSRSISLSRICVPSCL